MFRKIVERDLLRVDGGVNFFVVLADPLVLVVKLLVFVVKLVELGLMLLMKVLVVDANILNDREKLLVLVLKVSHLRPELF